MERVRGLRALILGWWVANFAPHLVVFVATGKIYYRLSPAGAIAAESSIMVLNLLLPILAGRYLLEQRRDVLSSLGWQWRGWRVAAQGQ